MWLGFDLDYGSRFDGDGDCVGGDDGDGDNGVGGDDGGGAGKGVGSTSTVCHMWPGLDLQPTSSFHLPPP